MTSICRHCSEPINLIGSSWSHAKTDKRRCEVPSTAEPVEDLAALSVDSLASYDKGFIDGRKAAELQERRSYNWNKQPLPLSAQSVALLNEMLTNRPADMKRIESACESPMEELFAVAVILKSQMNFDEQTNTWVSETLAMQTQVVIGRHRVDFVFNPNLVVEVDGHDFHDRTQEQASSDRARDRDLLRDGYLIMRFTGSDVYKNALSCAEEVEMFVAK